ncbi:MAG: hypothetical protein MUO53_08885, partial [Maribacter sp.]|nr:hypothetical protein [Maribacter sp.]
MRYLFVLYFLINMLLPQKAVKNRNMEEYARHPAIISEEFIYALDKALTPECHASTIAISNDAVIAAWFGGTKEK